MNKDIFIKVHDSIASLRKEDWESCSGAENPFLRHGFLSALEKSSSVIPESGWRPFHLTLENQDGKLLAVAPLYIKGHSYGEYVFDWSWARAFEQAGVRYYPKLLSAIPFTPATGQRILIHQGIPERDRESVKKIALSAMRQILDSHGLSSLHMTFCTEDEFQLGQQKGFISRTAIQYHWQNKGYNSFDDFLSALTSRKRREIRKERANARSHCDNIQWIQGHAITDEQWEEFYQFYLSTIEKKDAYAYLQSDFFKIVAKEIPDQTWLCTAWKDGKMLAAALNFEGADCLYGRYWGCRLDLPHLHFELCYYQAIDFAIKKKLSRVEAGAQGEHKIKRGYLPIKTYSLHYIRHEGLRVAVNHAMRQERKMTDQEMEYLMTSSPYKKHQPLKKP